MLDLNKWLDKTRQWWEQGWQLEEDRRQDFHKDLQLSNEARAVLEHPLVVRFFAETEAALYQKWVGTEPCQMKEREAAYEMLYLTRKFKEHFELFLASEEYALQQLAEMGKE